MCDMCDGMTLDEIIERDRARIATYGYTMVGVAEHGEPDDPVCWTYTMGLMDSAAHPELVVAGAPFALGARILASTAEAVLDGDRLLVGDWIDGGENIGLARVGAVDEIQRDVGTFAMWDTLQEAGVIGAGELEVVQILLPAAMCPFRDESWQPDLSDPTVRFGVGELL